MGKITIVGKLELLKENKKSSVLFYNKVSWLDEDNTNSFVFNESPNTQKGINQLFALENKIVFTRKIDSSQAIVAVARYIHQERPYDFWDDNDVFQHITGNQDVEKAYQKITSAMNFGGVKLSYLKNYSEKRNLEIQLGDEYRKDRLNSSLTLFNALDVALTFDNSDYINDTNLLQNKIFAQLKYTEKAKYWSYGLNLLSQVISSDYNGENQTVFYLSPQINIGYKNKKTGNFNLSASRKISAMSINDVFINYIYQGNRSLKKSETGFQILPDYRFSFSYNIGDMFSEYLNFDISYSRNEDYLSNNLIVNPNYILIQNILLKNNNNFSANLELRKYLKFLKSRMSLNHSYQVSDYQNSINSQAFLQTRYYMLQTGFEIKSGWSRKFNFETGYGWSFNKINSSTNNNTYTDQKGFLNLYYNFNPLLRLAGYLEHYQFGNTSQKSIQFLDIKFNYQLKKYKMNLFILGNNLLNCNSIQQYSVSNISESLYTQRLLPRNIVFGINKNF